MTAPRAGDAVAPGAAWATGAVLAVCAHPDDESFGLGAVLSALAERGTRTGVLCFTHGEASTLQGEGDGAGDLAAVRGRELAAAASVLGVADVELLDYPDGALDAQPLDELVAHVRRRANHSGARTLLVFDEGGVTGHPDHRRATEAALAAADADGLAVFAWAIPDAIAAALDGEFGVGFVGRAAREIDLVLPVARDRQLDAIARHVSQSADNPVLWRRLELLGPREHLRRLRDPATGVP